jgi:hypothetical protein
VLDRNFATAHAFIGHAKHHLGRAAETEAHVNEALRLVRHHGDNRVIMRVTSTTPAPLCDPTLISLVRRTNRLPEWGTSAERSTMPWARDVGF